MLRKVPSRWVAGHCLRCLGRNENRDRRDEQVPRRKRRNRERDLRACRPAALDSDQRGTSERATHKRRGKGVEADPPEEAEGAPVQGGLGGGNARDLPQSAPPWAFYFVVGHGRFPRPWVTLVIIRPPGFLFARGREASRRCLHYGRGPVRLYLCSPARQRAQLLFFPGGVFLRRSVGSTKLRAPGRVSERELKVGSDMGGGGPRWSAR